MKIRLWLMSMCFLSACSTLATTEFSGKSMTDRILRADVLADIKKYNGSVYKCYNISNVYSEVKNIQKTGNPKQPLIVDELWRVTACGKTYYYPINMRADERGETDYSLHLDKDIQSGNK